jgi:hypothetical protein
MVPLGGVGGDALDDATPRGADLRDGLTALAVVLIQVAKLPAGEIPGVVHGPGGHLQVGMIVSLVLPARGMNRRIYGHAEALAEVGSKLPHRLAHLLAACLMREGHCDRPGGGRIFPPLRSFGGGP